MVLQSLKDYLEVTPGDEVRVRHLLPVARSKFQRCSEVFQERLLSNGEARRALQTSGQLPRLRGTFVKWLEELLAGPWDEAYGRRRSRLGRFHARIGLAQHSLVAAVDVVRVELGALASGEEFDARAAVDKALDLDLALMADGYREAELAGHMHRERAATLGQLVGTMGHELRGPLAVMESSLFILNGRMRDDESAHKHLERIGQQVRQTNRKVVGMLDLIREVPLHRSRLTLADVVRIAIERAKVPAQVRLRREGLESTPDVQADPERLQALLSHLLENALQAIGEAPGEIAISGQRGGDGDVELSVMDSGPGVVPWLRRRLFEPLATTRPGALGLGLAVVRRIAELHQGSVEYEPGPPHRFTVWLPQA